MTDPEVPESRRGSDAGTGLRTLLDRLQGHAPLDWLTDVHKPVGKQAIERACADADRQARAQAYEPLRQALRQALITQLTHTQGTLSPSARARLMGWEIH